MFTDKIDPIIFNGMETIGGKYIIPKGIVTVIWYWTDYEGKIYTNKLNNLLAALKKVVVAKHKCDYPRQICRLQ